MNNELAVRTDSFFSAVVAKPATDISRSDMVKALLKYNDLNGRSVRSADIGWVEHVASTLPFSKVVALQMKFGDCDPMMLADRFLREAFAHLGRFGVSYDIGLDPDERGKAEMDKLVEASKKSGLNQQANYFQTDYARLCGLRRLFAMMNKNNLLTGPDFVLPMEHLGQTVMAEPVWFVGSKEKNRNQNNPMAPMTRRFCARLSTKEEADLFQLYNYQFHTLETFDGQETVPMPLMEVMAEALTFFDQVVITTPYRDLASDVWKNPERFVRSFDPEIFGFMNDKPYFIRLGRWSGTGFLAHKCDQIIETVLHLIANARAIEAFFNHYLEWFVVGDRPDLGHWISTDFSWGNDKKISPRLSVNKAIRHFTPPFMRQFGRSEEKPEGFRGKVSGFFRAFTGY